MTDRARRYFIPTPGGEVALVFEPSPRSSVLAIIHGAARRSIQLKPWLAHNAVLIELPGHGQAPWIEGGVADWARAFQAALDHLWPGLPVTLVGESLGGVISLHMSASRTILLDPPMQPTEAVEHEIRHGNVAEWLRPLIRADYWSLLDEQERVVEVVCGADGILPEAARARLACHPRVIFQLVAGGHVLLDDNPEAILQIVQMAPGRGEQRARASTPRPGEPTS